MTVLDLLLMGDRTFLDLLLLRGRTFLDFLLLRGRTFLDFLLLRGRTCREQAFLRGLLAAFRGIGEELRGCYLFQLSLGWRFFLITNIKIK
jgi:hypothetical protein